MWLVTQKKLLKDFILLCDLFKIHILDLQFNVSLILKIKFINM